MDKRNETPPKPAQPWFFPGRLTKPRPGCADVRRLSYRFCFRRNLSLVTSAATGSAAFQRAASITLLSRIIADSVKFVAAAKAEAGGSHQPRANRSQHRFRSEERRVG